MYNDFFNKDSQVDMRNFFLTSIAPLGKTKEYKKGAELDYFPNKKLSVIISGKVKISMYTIAGSEKILFFLIPGEIYGEESFSATHINIIPKAIEDTTVCFIDNEVLLEYSRNNSTFYEYIFHSVVRKYQISLFQMKDLLKSSPKSRICSTIYRMSIQYPIANIKSIEIIFPLTHEELANLVGCSRVTVTRVINELKNQGVIAIRNKKIFITDYEKLEHLSKIH